MMGLLAKQGIQNLVVKHEPAKRVTARLSAETTESARSRVLAALRGEPFTIESVQAED